MEYVDIPGRKFTEESNGFKFPQKAVWVFLLLFIDKDHVAQSVINIFDSKEHLNLVLLKRLMKYKRSNCQVILVTASPYKVVRPLATYLEVDSYHSTMLAGVLVRDLLGKK